jgi:hypothetical protein
MFDKLIDKIPPLVENQPLERIRQILIDSFIEIRNEMCKTTTIDLKFEPEPQEVFDRLILMINAGFEQKLLTGQTT